MIAHLTAAPFAIIGQSALNASHLLPKPLAALRAPSLLPDSLTSFFFETQWLYWLILAAAAAVLIFVGKTRADRRLRDAGLGCVALLAVWMLAAYLIDTPRERLYRAHIGLAQAARDADADRILSYLSPDFNSPALGVTHAQIAREEIGSRLKNYGIKGSTITFYRSDIAQKTAFTTLTLVTQTDAAGLVRTTWNLSWDDLAGADWKVREADLIKLGDEAVSTDRLLPQ